METKYKDKLTMANIETVAKIFAFNWITPWRCQSFTNGPNTL